MAHRGTRPTDDWMELAAVIRRDVTSRVGRVDDIEDVVQETLVRVAGSRGQLDRDAVPGYAIVTARNLITSRFRRQDRDRRHVHRLVEYKHLGEPEEATLRREESDALAAAFAQVPADDREVLIAHEVEGVSVETLAVSAETTAAAMAMRLARARARLRLEFVLAIRGVDDLAPECRKVLLAISAGDSRRQRTLGAARHVAHCQTCSELSRPLVERRRAIAGWLPVPMLLAAWQGLKRVIRHHPLQSGGAATAVAGAVTVAALALAPTGAAKPATPVPVSTTGSAPVASPAASLVAGGVPLLPIPPGGLAAYANVDVLARDVIVLQVVEGRGAWVGIDGTNQIWVEFTNPLVTDAAPQAVPADVTVGTRIDFTGRLSDNPPDYDQELGLDPEHAATLAAAGFHLHVDPATVVRMGTQ
jgi:RNA polymerase sigma factor (sigma-70 family)